MAGLRLHQVLSWPPPSARSLLGVDLLLDRTLSPSPSTTALVQLMARGGGRSRAITQDINGARGKLLNATISIVPQLGVVAVLHDITMLKELERIRHEHEVSEVARLRGTYERYLPPAIIDKLVNLGEDTLSRAEEREV